jgi:hypothetical protein
LHQSPLPDIATDPSLKGTREQLIRFVRTLDHHCPEVAYALRTRGAAFGMDKRPNLARVVADESPERAVTALLDGVEERQRAALKAEAEQKAALEARLRPRSSPSMGW